MSKKRKVYSAEFKSKLVLKVLEGALSINEIASKYEILPNNLKNWKKQFLENMSLVFDKSSVVKEYKEEIAILQKDSDDLAKKVATLTIEKDWLEGKLVSLDLSTKKEIIDNQADNKTVSLNRQLELLSISKTAYYYEPVVPFSKDEDITLLNTINSIYTKYPFYGHRRVHKLLLRLGFNIGRKMVKKAMKFMEIEPLYSKPRTTIENKEHKFSVSY